MPRASLRQTKVFPMNIHPSAAREPASALVTPVDWQDRPQLSFFDRHGEAAVSLARLAPGSVVLDLGCGAGAATLPAAHAEGRKGHVLGVVNAIYYWRARTEEAHLLAEDPKYRDYHAWMEENGVITAPLAKAKRWLLARATPQPRA